MKRMHDDRSGGLFGLAAFIIVLVILAYAVSVLFPSEWHTIAHMISTAWADLSHWLSQGWDALKGLFHKYLGSI
jgi:hypothetical protein